MGGGREDAGIGVDDVELHDGTFSFLGPGIVLFIGRVDEGVTLLVFLHELSHPATINYNT